MWRTFCVTRSLSLGDTAQQRYLILKHSTSLLGSSDTYKLNNTFLHPEEVITSLYYGSKLKDIIYLYYINSILNVQVFILAFLQLQTPQDSSDAVPISLTLQTRTSSPYIQDMTVQARLREEKRMTLSHKGSPVTSVSCDVPYMLSKAKDVPCRVKRLNHGACWQDHNLWLCGIIINK